MHHYFDIDIATKYGINAAIILQNLGHWIKRNEANESNYYDGYYWTFNSRRAYQELFPYMSKWQIEHAFKKLIEEGLVITGKYNEMKYDQTLWYALTEKAKCILHFQIMECAEMQNGNSKNGKPIPNINTDNIPNINTDIYRAKPKFKPPTLEEVKAYCSERNNGVDAQRFIDFYTSKGWMIGKNPMKDWKAAVRTWEKNSKKEEKSKETSYDLDEWEKLASNLFEG